MPLGTGCTSTLYAQIERLCFTTQKAFDDVLAGLYLGISRPDVAELMMRFARTQDLAEFQRITESAIGRGGLLEFLGMDLGSALGVGPGSFVHYRMKRIIAGNPIIMRRMAECVPDAGSYMPITILVYETDGGVRVCYDTLGSILALYDSRTALQMAKDQDARVISLIKSAMR